MKKLIILSFLLAGSFYFSQTVTKKYNTYNSQFEYFDDSNNMIAYEKYNSYLKQWEYYELKNIPRQPYQYSKPVQLDISSLGNAMIAKQNRYNENAQQVQNTVNTITDQINNLDISESDRTLIIDTFTKQINKNINSTTVNYSSASVTNNIIKWLYETANTIVKNVTSNTSKNYSSDTSDYLSKYYNTTLKVWRIAIYENGSKVGKDDFITSDSYINIQPEFINFKRADGSISVRHLTNKRPNTQKGGYEYSTTSGAVFIDWNMKYVEFFSGHNPTGDNYTYFISK